MPEYVWGDNLFRVWDQAVVEAAILKKDMYLYQQRDGRFVCSPRMPDEDPFLVVRHTDMKARLGCEACEGMER